ncbi:MAG TPA: glycosyltransferase [Polyangiaceae bacterium]|jgi:glycosyltransferase involved in cell wall biosynthesis
MRLAIEITTCTASRTGVGYYTEHLVDALLETRRPQDEVLLLSNRAPAPELASRWAPHLRVGGLGVRALWMQRDVPRFLAEAKIDAAVFPNYVVPVASPCPTIVVVHDLAILRMPEHFTLRKQLLMRAMLGQSLASASIISTVSEASQRDITELLGIPRDRILILPGAPHPSSRPATAAAVAEVRARHGIERPYLLTVGTLEPRKDLPTLLRAFDRVEREVPDHDLVVVGGRGWKDAHIVRALEVRASSRRVRWLGYVAESELAALYTGADLFAFAAHLEGIGLPVLEAMACGAPVVASDIAALREVGGDVPHYVPPGDDQAFARAIAVALRNPAAREAARSAGPARAAHFSWTRTAEILWAQARVGASERIPVSRSVAVASDSAPTLPAPLHPPPSTLGPREWALLATTVYADLFDSPLPIELALAASIGIALDEAELRRLAKGTALSRILTLDPRGYLVLAGREHLVDAMPERKRATQKLLQKNRGMLSTLASLPFVRSLVISGGVAHDNPGARPDVDFFVVAAHGRAYTAYTMLFLATKMTGTRHIICPNYLVDESELTIAYHRDLFTGHELASALPFSGQDVYEALCHANETWLEKLFPGFRPKAPPGSPTSTTLRDMAERVLGPLGPALEASLRWAWRARLRRRATAVAGSDIVLGDGILKLHLSDYRHRVLARFSARLDGLRAELESGTRSQQTALGSVGT